MIELIESFTAGVITGMVISLGVLAIVSRRMIGPPKDPTPPPPPPPSVKA